MSERFDELIADTFRPLIRVPRHPVRLAAFGHGMCGDNAARSFLRRAR